jgi:hypothetical protein
LAIFQTFSAIAYCYHPATWHQMVQNFQRLGKCKILGGQQSHPILANMWKIAFHGTSIRIADMSRGIFTRTSYAPGRTTCTWFNVFNIHPERFSLFICILFLYGSLQWDLNYWSSLEVVSYLLSELWYYSLAVFFVKFLSYFLLKCYSIWIDAVQWVQL